MFDSHASCRDLYECSHPQLDQLVHLATEHCLGARLTGAGWGGCMVALMTDSQADDYIRHLTENYYGKLAGAEEIDLKSVIFKTEPGSGAAIYQL